MNEQNLVGLILDLSVHSHYCRTIKGFYRDEEYPESNIYIPLHGYMTGHSWDSSKRCLEASDKLIKNAKDAIRLLCEALDYKTFYNANKGEICHATKEESTVYSEDNRICDTGIIYGRHGVEDALIKIGEPAKQSLIENLNNENPNIRFGSAYCLTRLGETDKVFSEF